MPSCSRSTLASCPRTLLAPSSQCHSAPPWPSEAASSPVAALRTRVDRCAAPGMARGCGEAVRPSRSRRFRSVQQRPGRRRGLSPMVAASGYIRLQPLTYGCRSPPSCCATPPWPGPPARSPLRRPRWRRHTYPTPYLLHSYYYTPTYLLLLTLLLLTLPLTMPRWRRRGARSTSGGRRRRTACSLTKPTITHSSLTLTFIPVAQPAARPRLVSPSRLPTAGPLGSAAERRPRGPRSAAPGRSLWRRSRRRPRCIVDRSGQSRGRRQRSSPPPRRRSRRAPPAATSYASAPTPRRRP